MYICFGFQILNHKISIFQAFKFLTCFFSSLKASKFPGPKFLQSFELLDCKLDCDEPIFLKNILLDFLKENSLISSKIVRSDNKAERLQFLYLRKVTGIFFISPKSRVCRIFD